MKKPAFTLIELIVTMAIFLMIATLSSSVIVFFIRQKQHHTAQLLVNQEARNVVESISRDLKVAFGSDDKGAIQVNSGSLVIRQSNETEKTYRTVSVAGRKKVELVSAAYKRNQVSALDPEDIVIFIDLSGSMLTTINGQTKFSMLKTALNEFLTILRDAEDNTGQHGAFRIAIVTYNECTPESGDRGVYNRTNGFQPLTYDFATLINNNPPHPNGGTCMGGALRLGNQIMAASTSTKKLGILMTDGCASEPKDNCNAWRDHATYGVNSNIPTTPNEYPVYTIGLGKQTDDISNQPISNQCNYRWNTTTCMDFVTLQYVAGQTGGEAILAEDSVALTEAYKKIAGEVSEIKYVPDGTPSTADLNSSEVDIKKLDYVLSQDANGWPYVTIDLVITTGKQNTPRFAQAKFNTVISSREYRED